MTGFPEKLKETLLAAVSGILLTLAFPTWNLSGFAWIALIPLFFAIEGKSPARAFWLGWISGFFFFFGTLSWIITTIVTYGHISRLTGFLAFSLMCIILSLYPGLFAWGITICRRSLSVPRSVVNPLIWTGTEFLRAHFFIPFPWSSLGYSQYQQTALIQFSDITSVFGVSFIILLVNTVLFEPVFLILSHGRTERPPFRFSRIPLVATAGLFSAIFIYGAVKLHEPGPGFEVKVSVIQGNVDQDRKWDDRYRNETLLKYEELTRRAASDHPDLILWPETAAPFLFEREPVYREKLERFIAEIRIPLLFGSPALDPSPEGDKWFNSAYFLDSAGRIVDRYDKMKLVPFGEYVPFHRLLFFVNKITEGIGDFSAGNRSTVFAWANRSFGTLVCFEVIFPEVFRTFVSGGADFMTTITNDAWFGETAAPYQHFSMVVFRAIENRTPVARAANTGISGFIDSRGRILATSALFVTDEITGRLKYYREKTFYSNFGDVFGWSVLIMSLTVLIIAFRKGKQYAG